MVQREGRGSEGRHGDGWLERLVSRPRDPALAAAVVKRFEIQKCDYEEAG
jgi:hypothetical protein